MELKFKLDFCYIWLDVCVTMAVNIDIGEVVTDLQA